MRGESKFEAPVLVTGGGMRRTQFMGLTGTPNSANAPIAFDATTTLAPFSARSLKASTNAAFCSATVDIDVSQPDMDLKCARSQQLMKWSPTPSTSRNFFTSPARGSSRFDILMELVAMLCMRSLMVKEPSGFVAERRRNVFAEMLPTTKLIAVARSMLNNTGWNQRGSKGRGVSGGEAKVASVRTLWKRRYASLSVLARAKKEKKVLRVHTPKQDSSTPAWS